MSRRDPYETEDEAMLRLERPNGWSSWYVLCADCEHFVDANDAHVAGDGLAEFVHLDNGEKDHDHDAWPREATSGTHWGESLHVWMQIRPDLFVGYPDGEIGPNSIHFIAPERRDPWA